MSKWLEVEKAAEVLDISIGHVYRLARSGKMKSRKVKGKTEVDIEVILTATEDPHDAIRRDIGEVRDILETKVIPALERRPWWKRLWKRKGE